MRGLNRHTEFSPGFDGDCDGACGLVKDQLDFSSGRRPIDPGHRSPQFGKRGALVGSIRSSNGPDPAEMYFSVGAEPRRHGRDCSGEVKSLTDAVMAYVEILVLLPPQ